MTQREQIMEIIAEHKIPKDMEKGKFGEVFTPLILANKMLNMLPASVWTDKTLTWLDPTCGIGNFMILIYWRLMVGLKDEPTLIDTAERSRHIIENMLFMVEINQENSDKLIKIFEILDDSCKVNILTMDFFDYKPQFLFDIIVENPPYNINGTKGLGQKNVYVFFAIRSLEILKDRGYFLVIHPSPYRISGYKLKATKTNLNIIYTCLQIHSIHMYTIIQTYELMNVQMNVDSLLIQKKPSENNTHIEDIFGEKIILKINLGDTIPNFGFNIMNKLKSLCNQYGNITNLVYRSSELHHNYWKTGKVKAGKYPIIHLLKHPKKGNNIYSSDKKHTHQHTPKIIINSLGVKYVFLDIEGKYGVTDSPFLILSNSAALCTLLKSTLFNFIINTLGILGNNLNSIVFEFIPDITKITKEDITENEIYDLIQFDPEEKKRLAFFSTKNIQNLKLKDRQNFS